MNDARIMLPDGRSLAWTDIGEPDWPSAFFFHGGPSSRFRLSYLEREIVAERVRVVSPDRPGYGGSSPQPGRSMVDWPADVAAIADELRIDRFIVAGHSGGGPYALACAALLPDRVSACIVLAGVTDMGWPGAWDGFVESECELMRLPQEAAATEWCAERYGEDGSGFMSASDFEFGAPDLVLYSDRRVASELAAAREEAFRQGVHGYAQDVVVQGRPWPFDPQSISVPVHVLHGEEDALLPAAHSRHTTERVPGATLRILPGHGHFTILSELPGTVASLARQGSDST